MGLIVTNEREFDSDVFNNKIGNLMSSTRLSKAKHMPFDKYFVEYGGIHQFKRMYNILLLRVGLPICDLFATD